MIFRNHLIVTGAVTLVVVKSLELGLPLWAVIGGIFFGSLLPDLDHPSSTIGKRVLFVSVPLAGLFGHRQFTHSIWPLIFTIWLFNLTEHANGYVMVLMIGYMSHIIADMLTDSGVPLLWPVQKRFGITICKTGGVLEHIVAYGLLAVALIL
ncbi:MULTISPECIES: metal-dependent hydrolase [Shewanella]|uniref:metal-dependent hydrolase n=1 Tax=Shewanella TaxID=22 RepID=UPI0013DE1F96|nr:metal-dependent hydrolase [Shewanella algae]